MCIFSGKYFLLDRSGISAFCIYEHLKGVMLMKKHLLRAAVFCVLLAVLLPCIFAGTEMVSPFVPSLQAASLSDAHTDGDYIRDIPIGTTAKELLNRFAPGGKVTMFHGYTIGEGSRVGTGYKLVKADGQEYTLLVDGDLDGDTYVTGKDLVRAKKHLKTGNNFYYESVLDFNKDGSFTQADLGGFSGFIMDDEPKRDVDDRPAKNLGASFYATIDLSYTDNSLGVNLGSNAVVASDKTTSANQIWHFLLQEDGSYIIENVGMGQVLDLSYASTEMGTTVGVYKNLGTENQRWYLIEYEGGYIIRSMCGYDRVLDVFSASTENDAAVDIYGVNYSDAQIFYLDDIGHVDLVTNAYFDSVGPLNQPMFYTTLKFNNGYIGVDSSNNVCIKPYGHYWQFLPQTDGTYIIKSAQTGKVLDVFEAKMDDGTNIQVYDSNGTTAQRWYAYMRLGKITLMSALGGDLVVDVYSASDDENTNVHLYTSNLSPAQQFIIDDYRLKLPEYTVTCPYGTTVYGQYESLEEAKANTQAHYGQVVRQGGNVVYNPCPTMAAARILHHAKLDADYARIQDYTYGDASVNPALNKSEKVVSCDRFVGWVLYDAGFARDRQPATKGFTLYGPMENLLISLGFQKHTNLADVRPGDIIFVGYSNNLAVPANYKNYPCHVFISAGAYGANTYRYDAGSNTRLDSVQPSYEPLSYSNMPFRFAYRPID